VRKQLLALSRSEANFQATTALDLKAQTEMNPLAVQYTVAVANSAALEARELDQAGAATEAALRSTRWSLVLAQGLTLAAGIRLCLFISREVDRVFGGIVASRTDVSHQISSTAAQVSSSSRSLAEGAGHPPWCQITKTKSQQPTI
jgi:hypothetical protein